jgi:membrane-associated phospholipid phosphatase
VKDYDAFGAKDARHRTDGRCIVAPLMRGVWKLIGALATALLVGVPSAARADDPPAAAAPSAPSSVPATAGAPAVARPTAAPTPWIVPASVQPVVTQPPAPTAPFQIDPISDGALIAAGAGYGGVLELILSTGEIRPQRPVDPNALLGIDSVAVRQSFDPGANTRSNIGLFAALAFAVVDPVLSGFRDGRTAAVVDATLYAESLSLTFALTDLAKIAVRRPRPSAYVAQAALDQKYGPNGPSITDTDQSLSFFSGHAALCAATTATASYLAFTRAPGTWRPWVTLIAGSLLTAGVGYERVRAGAHFPTDVIAGALAGAGVGLIVPHLHRRATVGHQAVWVGLGPASAGVGLALQGIFL